tara:strand:+ start:833 stop:1006 length:174 start_codon:yes stop_codon:yes gene_type:complete
VLLPFALYNYLVAWSYIEKGGKRWKNMIRKNNHLKTLKFFLYKILVGNHYREWVFIR